MIRPALGCMWGFRQLQLQGRNRELTLMGPLERLVHQDHWQEVLARDANLVVGPKVQPSRLAGRLWASAGPLWSEKAWLEVTLKAIHLMICLMPEPSEPRGPRARPHQAARLQASRAGWVGPPAQRNLQAG